MFRVREFKALFVSTTFIAFFVAGCASTTPRADKLDPKIRAQAIDALKTEQNLRISLSQLSLDFATFNQCEVAGPARLAVKAAFAEIKRSEVRFRESWRSRSLSSKDELFILERRLKEIEDGKVTSTQNSDPADINTILKALAVERRRTSAISIWLLDLEAAIEAKKVRGSFCSPDFAKTSLAAGLSALSASVQLQTTQALSKEEQIALTAEQVRRDILEQEAIAQQRRAWNDQVAQRHFNQQLRNRVESGRRRALEWKPPNPGRFRNTPAPTPHRPPPPRPKF